MSVTVTENGKGSCSSTFLAGEGFEATGAFASGAVGSATFMSEFFSTSLTTSHPSRDSLPELELHSSATCSWIRAPGATFRRRPCGHARSQLRGYPRRAWDPVHKGGGVPE